MSKAVPVLCEAAGQKANPLKQDLPRLPASTCNGGLPWNHHRNPRVSWAFRSAALRAAQPSHGLSRVLWQAGHDPVPLLWRRPGPGVWARFPGALSPSRRHRPVAVLELSLGLGLSFMYGLSG